MHSKLFWIVILGAAGLVANELFTVPVHSGAAFRFGGIFVLLTALALGPKSGALAGLLTAWPLVAAGDAHMAVLGVAEAFVVGHLVKRRMMPLTSDLAFWALASPLLLAWGARGDGALSATAWVPALNAPVNGALCAIVADVLLLLWTTRIPGPRRLAPERRQSLRWHLVHWLALVTLVPMLIVGLSVGRERASEKAAEAERALARDIEKIASALDALVAENLRAVESLGRTLTLSPTNETGELIARLEGHRLTYDSLSTLLVADGTGQLIAGAPPTRGGVRWWNHSVADRQYFQVPMATGRSMVSDVFLGSGFGINAIVALAAPIFDRTGETVERVVEASMDVRELQRHVRPLAPPSVRLVVIDRDRRVVFGLGENRQRPLEALAESSLADAASKRVTGGELHLSRAEADGQRRRSSYAVWRPVPVAGWTVLGEVPSQALDLAAARVYLGYASGLLLAVVLTSLFATAIALRITGPIERLVAALRDVEADSLPAVPEAGSTAPREMVELVDSFGAMAGRLEQSYRQLHQSLDERQALNWELEQLLGDLDRRVRERTAELVASRREALELQRLYRGLLDDIEAIVCEYDLTHRRFTFVSRRSAEILGYPPEDWYEDRAIWFRLLPTEHRPELLEAAKRITDGGGSYALEHPIRTAGGEELVLRNVGRVLDGDDGARVLRCVMLDVTAAKRAQEDQLRRRQLEAVGTLAGGIAHDFNNLLTTMLGNLSLARLEAEDGGDPAELLEQIEAAGHDARRLSHQLLTFARGGQPILKPCNLYRRLRALEREAVEGGVSVCFSAPADLPKVLADRQQLYQVIHELLRNAEQALPEGGRIDIQARVEQVEEDSELGLEAGPYVAFTVSDDGEGVPADLMSRVFEPYFTTRDDGRGFGLATAYSIAQNHGGHISFRSVQGQGTSVTVWRQAAKEATVREAPRPAVASLPSPGRLLLMDDEASVRLVAGRMFKRLGWQVTATADGEEAVEAYRRALADERPFDLVFTDLTVPGGMGGAETMRRLLELDGGVRAVVCSGYSNDPVMAQYREHGFAGVMTKPFTFRDLERIITQAMRVQLPEMAGSVGSVG